MLTTTMVYTSKAMTPVTAESLKELAQQAAINNAQTGVTGLLLYGSGSYMQVLEGSQPVLNILYARICNDKRHAECDLLYERRQIKRLFPEWNMGQLNLDEPDSASQTVWALISSTLARAGAVDWKDTDPVIGWVREFMEHNGGAPGTSAA